MNGTDTRGYVEEGIWVKRELRVNGDGAKGCRWGIVAVWKDSEVRGILGSEVFGEPR